MTSGERWIELCVQWAQANSALSGLGSIEAFPLPSRTSDTPPSPPPLRTFAELLQWAAEQSKIVPEAVSLRLTTIVGGPQASMFAGRLENLLASLTVEQRSEAKFLLVATVVRIRQTLELCADPVPRIRSIIDFYYSQLAMLHWRDGARQLPSITHALHRPPWRRLVHGIRHAAIVGHFRQGPVSMHLLKIDQGKARFRSHHVADGAAMNELHQIVAECGAVAGFTGGFFLYSEPSIQAPSKQFDPVGLLVSDGKVVVPPILSRPVFFQDQKGFIGITRLGLKGCTITHGSLAVKIGATNLPQASLTAPTAYNAAFGEKTPDLQGPSVAFVGARPVGLAESGPVSIPVNGFVLALPKHAQWLALAQQLANADSVDFLLPKISGFAPFADAMAGGPTLLSGGEVLAPDWRGEEFMNGAPPVTLASDETSDQNLLPRLAVGITPAFEVVVMAVDGRDLNAAFGATLSQTARWLKALGCSDAVNLDGGSSKRLASSVETFGNSAEGLLVPGATMPDASLRRRRLVTTWTISEQRTFG